VIPYPRTWVEVDLPALAFNVGLVRQAVGSDVRIALVAKADAYGHGLIPVARFAAQHGVDWIAVATVQEGIALRDAGLECPIVVLSPILPLEAEQAVFYQLRVLVERLETAEAMSQAALRQRAEAIVHLKVDTGLARFGCLPGQAPLLAENIAALPNVRLEGIATHFANSGFDPEFTQVQIERFDEAIRGCSSRGLGFDVVHAANSAGAMRFPAGRYSMVRVGIFAYGVDPYALSDTPPRPVLSWHSRVTAYRELAPGEPVGYSSTFRTVRETKLATVGVGYGDGYPRSLSNRGAVSIGGRIAPVVGLVCMDQLLVDVTDLPPVAIGDEVLLIGGGVSVLDLARLGDTNAHEITTRIMSRVARRYRHTESANESNSPSPSAQQVPNLR
jgi:alanine racemase